MKASIAKKLSEVGKAIGFGVPKDGRNKAQGYDFVSASGLKMAVGPELAKRSIAVSSTVEVLEFGEIETKSGGKMQRLVARVTLTFVDGDSGEQLSAQGLGGGSDSGDKAAMKAFTAAEKYAYVSAFGLALGEDPERDESTDHQTSERHAPDRHASGGRQEPRRSSPAAEAVAGAIGGSDAAQTALEHLNHCDDEASLMAWFAKWLPRLGKLPDDARRAAWAAFGARAKSLGIKTERMAELRKQAAGSKAA